MSKPQYTLQELKTMPYQDYLKSDHWLATRRQALWDAGRRCRVCNSEHELQAHHRTYERRGEEDPGDITVLCRRCHEIFHDILPQPDSAPKPVFNRRWSRKWNEPQPASPQLKAMANLTGEKRTLERRERMIVLTLINHPALLGRFLDEFAEATFASRELGSLRTLIINIAALDPLLDAPALRAQLLSKGMGPSLSHLDGQSARLNEWFIWADASLDDAETGLRQMFAMHRKLTGLKDEMDRAAESFTDEPTEANFLAVVRAREKQGFGFGSAMGRAEDVIA